MNKNANSGLSEAFKNASEEVRRKYYETLKEGSIIKCLPGQENDYTKLLSEKDIQKFIDEEKLKMWKEHTQNGVDITEKDFSDMQLEILTRTQQRINEFVKKELKIDDNSYLKN